MPAANSAEANRPAIGSRARAASAAVWTSRLPCAPSVAPELTMIANITSTPADMPDTTSTRIARICRASTRPIRPALRSSTSSAACQTNRYGEIVVPKIATSASTDARVGWKLGIRPAATWDQFTSTTNSSRT